MTHPTFDGLLSAAVAGLIGGTWLIFFGFRELARLRCRCYVSRADAEWLAKALGEHTCPWCDRELMNH